MIFRGNWGDSYQSWQEAPSLLFLQHQLANSRFKKHPVWLYGGWRLHKLLSQTCFQFSARVIVFLLAITIIIHQKCGCCQQWGKHTFEKQWESNDENEWPDFYSQGCAPQYFCSFRLRFGQIKMYKEKERHFWTESIKIFYYLSSWIPFQLWKLPWLELKPDFNTVNGSASYNTPEDCRIH